jgi:acetyl esterase/lipase
MHREVFLACRGLPTESIAPQRIAAGDSAGGGLALSRPSTGRHPSRAKRPVRPR